MYKKDKYNIDIVITLLFGGLISFLGYLFNIYLARNLSSEDFSIYNAAIGIIYLVQIPAITIQSYITKKVGENADFDLSAFKRKSILGFTAVGVVTALTISIFSSPISSFTGINQSSVYVLAFVLFASIISPVAKGILFGLERILEANIVMLVETALKFGMGIVSIWVIKDINIAILANGLPLLITGVLLLPFIKFKQKEKKEIGIDLKYLTHILISFFLINTPFALDLILVNHEIRAEYGALSLLGKIVFFACIMISSTMFSRISNVKSEIDRRKVLLKTVGLTSAIGVVLVSTYFIFNEALVSFIFKGMYTQISDYIGVYGIGMVLFAISYLLTNYFINVGKKGLNTILLFIPILQITLFIQFNSSIEDIVRNQLILFISLLISLTLLFFFSNKGEDGGNKHQ